MREEDVYDEILLLYPTGSYHFRAPKKILTDEQRARKNDAQRRYREKKREREAKERARLESDRRLRARHLLTANAQCRRVAPLLCEGMITGSHDLSVVSFYTQLSTTLGYEVTPLYRGLSVITLCRANVPALVEFLRWVRQQDSPGPLIQALRPVLSYVLFDGCNY